MIGYRPPPPAERFAQPMGPPPPPAPSPFEARDAESFLDRWIPVCGASVFRIPGGYIWGQRRYVARRGYLSSDGSPFWAAVHDDPADLAHFDKLFGREA